VALNINQNSGKGPRGSIPARSVNSSWGELFSFLKTIVVFFSIALMLRASVVEAFKIPSSSMEPTLEIGDHILVNKLSYGARLPLVSKTIFNFRAPKRGDVVVFTLPDDPRTADVNESKTNIIKRIIGLPGDQIEVEGMNVSINGEELDEDYARWFQGGRKDYPKIDVPKDHVFLMGDNRDHSKDSRYWQHPFLDVSRVKGRAFVIYWNTSLSFKRMFNTIK